MARYEEIQHSALGHAFSIPILYKSFLTRLNGATLFTVDLYGLPASMSQSPPLLDRTVRQPLDLGTAQLDWGRGYKAKLDQFHFGGGPYSDDQNVAYFLNVDGSVEALLEGGDLVCGWPSFSEFLAGELSRVEHLFASFEQQRSDFMKSLNAHDKRRKKS